MDDLSLLVQSELAKQFPKAQYIGHDLVTCCPFHSDKHPSFSVCIETHEKKQAGIFNCWSPDCGAKGSWNTLAEKLGLKKYKFGPKWDTDISNLDFTQKKEYVYTKSVVTKTLDGFSWKRKSGTITNRTLRSFNCKLCVDDSERMYIPVKCYGEIQGHVLAYITQTKKKVSDYVKKYINSKGDWPTRNWFGWDQAQQLSQDYVCLVEGPADAMMMYQQNIPAIALLGNTWSEEKANYLVLNYKKIILCFDGDKSGRAYKSLVKKDLAGSHLEIKSIKFDAGTDPASLQEDGYKQLLRVIHKFIS